VVQDITDKVDILLETPRLGRMVPEIGEDAVREIGMYSYRIMYELFGDTIYIHGIVHKRRHFQPEDLQRP
jgi:plasmid stabilization system protein ParE